MSRDQDEPALDEVVSETYRELVAEQTPEHLNQSVLAMVRTKPESLIPGGTLIAAWLKPVAFTAMLGLSLVIVLEVTKVPVTAVQQDAEPAAQSIREELIPQHSGALKISKDRALQQARPSQMTSQALEIQPGAKFELDSPSTAVCDDTVRRQAESWRNCIEILRSDGAVEVAEFEYEAYILKFPDEPGILYSDE
jgi:hypothetical protein